MTSPNPQIQIPGHVPHLGLYEPLFAMLLACIVAVHLAIFTTTVFWMKKVEINQVTGHEMHPTGAQHNESQEHLIWMQITLENGSLSRFRALGPHML